MNQPIKYIIENKNGKYYISDSFDVHDKINMIRIIIKHPIYERNPLTRIVKNISNKEKNIPFDDRNNDYSGQCSTVTTMPIDEFINNTSDLMFELIENSKIELNIFTDYKLPELNYAMPNLQKHIK